MSKMIFFIVFSALALVFGLAFIIAPDKFGELVELEASGSVTTMARMMGAAMLAWGMMLWSARRFDEEAQAAVLRATGFGGAVGAASACVASASGAMNWFGWIVALIFLFGAMACMWTLAREQKSNVVGEDSRGVFDRLIA